MRQLIEKNTDFSAQQDCIDNYCCVTHATSVEFLATDKNNICRDINKMAVASFLAEFKAAHFEPSFDRLMTYSERDLNMIMPLLNSVQLWGRYKQ